MHIPSGLVPFVAIDLETPFEDENLFSFRVQVSWDAAAWLHLQKCGTWPILFKAQRLAEDAGLGRRHPLQRLGIDKGFIRHGAFP